MIFCQLLNIMLEIEKIAEYNQVDLINKVSEKININLTKNTKNSKIKK